MKPAQGTADTGRHLQAAEWLTRLQEPQAMTAAELKSWQQFIASPENREAIEALQRVVRVAPTVALRPLPSAEELGAQLAQDTYDPSMPVRRWRAEQASAPSGEKAVRHAGWRSGWLWRGAVAAACALLVALSVWLTPAWFASTRLAVHTEAAQHRVVALDDGSRIAVGAKTAIEVRYTSQRRVIYLERGEALFTVAHDLKRPFVVFAGAGSVTAVGTQFNIWRDLDRTKVTVTDGVVHVEPVDAPRTVGSSASRPSPGARVMKGQEITYAESGLSSVVQVADLATATAWLEGQLVYRHTPLKYVIADVNRYFRQQLVLGDTEVGELEFSGAVPQNLSPTEFVRALERIFQLDAVEIGDGRIVIRSRVPLESKPSSSSLVKL